jgi:hypothetical protein
VLDTVVVGGEGLVVVGTVAAKLDGVDGVGTAGITIGGIEKVGTTGIGIDGIVIVGRATGTNDIEPGIAPGRVTADPAGGLIPSRACNASASAHAPRVTCMTRPLTPLRESIQNHVSYDSARCGALDS